MSDPSSMPSTVPGDGSLDDAPKDVAESAALITEQRTRVAQAMDVDARLLFGAWGIAWLLGFGVQWALALDEPLLPISAQVGQGVFGVLLATAGAITAVHSARRSSGMVGTSVRQGAMYGWAWAVTFAGVLSLGIALNRSDVGADVTATVLTACAVIAVSALYMAGGALWDDWTQFALGAWIGLVTIVAVIVGYPHLLAVMAVLGGGGMLVVAVIEGLRRR